MPDGARPRRVSLFVTCLVDLVGPEIGEASVALLEDLGVEVDFPPAQVCCGQPALNAGFDDEARRVGRTLLEAFDGSEHVVAPSGSCAAMVRAWFPRLFAGTPDEGRARALAERTHELTSFVVDVLGVERIDGAFAARATYHDSCHGLRELGVRDQGRRLLAGIDGLQLVEMARPEQCCGFGGTFSLRLPEVATAMADDKLDQARATGAEVVVGTDLGCLIHLAGRAARTGTEPRPMHLATMLARARDLIPEEAPPT